MYFSYKYNVSFYTDTKKAANSPEKIDSIYLIPIITYHIYSCESFTQIPLFFSIFYCCGSKGEPFYATVYLLKYRYFDQC